MNDRNNKAMKVIALLVLLVYVISPVDAAPGPIDDIIMCLLYAVMNNKNIRNEIFGRNDIEDKEPA